MTLLNEKNMKSNKKNSSIAILDERNITEDKKIKSKKSKVKSSFAEIAPIIDITSNDFFEMRGGEFLEIIQIETKDIYSLNTNDLNNDITNLNYFYTAYTHDIKIVPLNVPLNLEEQKDNIHKLIKKNKNPAYSEILNARLEEFELLEQNRTNREYFIFLYADDEKKLLERIQHAALLLNRSNPVIKLSIQKKQNILHQMFNPNTKPLSDTE